MTKVRKQGMTGLMERCLGLLMV